MSTPTGWLAVFRLCGTVNQTDLTYPDKSSQTKSYDALGQLTQVTDAENEKYTYTYDDAGNVTKLTYPNGWVEEYTYDAEGNLLKTVDTDPFHNNKKSTKYQYSYDAEGNLITEYQRDSDGEAGLVANTTYTYDALNRLTSSKKVVERTRKTYAKTYTYDSLGNLVQENGPDSRDQTTYQYNSLNQMVARKECGYVQSITRIHDYGYTYDGRGNLVKEEEICSPTTQGPKNITIATYTYDETNKMVSGTNKDGEVSNYTFNGLGVRVGTEVIVRDNTHGYTDFHCQTPTVETGIDKPEVVLSDYVIDYTRLNIDQRVLVESETDGYDFRYTYGLDLVNVKATGEGTNWWAQIVKKCVYSDYVHTDRLGSVVNLTDQYGRVPAQVDYDDWGKVTAYQSLNISGGYRTVLPEITYAGHQYDDVLGMYYAKARMYDADNRRFASVDPVKGRITEPMTMVQYLYVVDNPLRWVDPLGLEQVAKKEEGGIPQEPTIQSADELIATEIASTISDDTRSQLSLVAALFGTDGAFMVGFASGIVQAIEDFTIGNLVSLADHAKSVNTSLVSVDLQPQLYDSSQYQRYVDSTNTAAEWLAKFTGHPDAFYAGRMIADALIQSFGIAAKYLGVGATAAGFTAAMKSGSAALLGAMVGGPGGAAIATASNLAVDMALAVGGAAVAAAGEVVSQAAAGRREHDSAKYSEYHDKLQCEENKNKVNWTPHGHKHFPDKSKAWDQIVQSTKNGPAKYSLDIADIEAFEREAWATGTPTTNGKNWRVKSYDKIIGATGGKETSYVRIECSANTIHGHPISEQEYLKLLK